MWRSNQPVHCSNRDLRLERHISESATLRNKWARAHLLREIRTAGSDWGDESKKPCRLGEVDGAKAPPATRLRKGYRFEARLYRP